MKSTKFFLLASTALFAAFAVPPQAEAAAPAPLMLAQAAPPAPAPAPDAKKEPEKKEQPPAAKPAAPPAPPPPAAQAPKPPAPPPPPAAQAPKPPAAPPPPAAQQKPPAPPAPAAQQTPPAPPASAAPQRPAAAPAQAPAAQSGERREQRREERRDERRQDRREDRREERRDAAPGQTPADRKQSDSKPPAPAPQQQPAATTAPAKPAEAPKTAEPPKPAEAPKAAQPAAPPSPAPAAKSATPPASPAPAQQPAQADQKPAPAATQQQAAPAAAPQPPTQPRDAREFIRRDNQAPQRGLDDIRRERREVRQGNRTVISEGDRTIVRQDNRTIIRHSEAARFAIGARDVRVDRRGSETFTVVARPNGISIVSVTDADGRLIRRVRRDARGREIVIIDNRRRGPRAEIFVDLPPPRIRIPRERYIVDAGRASRAEIYEVFLAPPVERIERSYTVEQVRYSDPLRERMPRVDLDINFESGSWQLTPDQVDRLADIADGLKRAIARNPREVFLIEGHTDAVGSDEDNLSLSDRRAEAVAVALTEQFQVPPENLVTQGYGEQYLKVRSEEAERANRRVAVRRITPLVAQAER